ncbi:MAG TPA: thioredoxin family protein [Ramlibacter sp.]|nr:thioredoxin family protein [Ramlibacter sp.]
MTDAPPSSPADTPEWQVICLCADWCGACREWRPQFEQAASAHPLAQFAWVDIEDQADVVGDVDVETFPTLLVAHKGQARFLGPVLPAVAQIGRLLASLRDDPRAGAVPPEAPALLRRLNQSELRLI